MTKKMQILCKKKQYQRKITPICKTKAGNCNCLTLLISRLKSAHIIYRINAQKEKTAYMLILKMN